MSTVPPAAGKLHIVVGFDGSAPAVRALDSAVSLLHGRDGDIEVVYVAHLTGLEMLSADAIVEMEETFNQMAEDLRAQVGKQLADHEQRWNFRQRQGLIAQQLIEEAEQIAAARPGEPVMIVVGSSSQAAHRMVGSAAVALARHASVPIVIVP